MVAIIVTSDEQVRASLYLVTLIRVCREAGQRRRPTLNFGCLYHLDERHQASRRQTAYLDRRRFKSFRRVYWRHGLKNPYRRINPVRHRITLFVRCTRQTRIVQKRIRPRQQHQRQQRIEKDAAGEDGVEEKWGSGVVWIRCVRSCMLQPWLCGRSIRHRECLRSRQRTR
jgi:hypothetical protein